MLHKPVRRLLEPKKRDNNRSMSRGHLAVVFATAKLNVPQRSDNLKLMKISDREQLTVLECAGHQLTKCDKIIGGCDSPVDSEFVSLCSSASELGA